MARRRALATAAFAAVTALVISAAPAGAAAPSYVALGDSYSSGTGTRSYLSDGTSCGYRYRTSSCRRGRRTRVLRRRPEPPRSRVPSPRRMLR